FQGGTPSSSSAQNPSITYAAAGTYSVSLTATNAGGSDVHSAVGYITVTAPIATPLSTTNISCNGSTDGSATVAVSSGTPAYSYNWTPGNPAGDGTPTITGLVVGTYTCTVTDANSCTSTASFTITQPAVLDAVRTTLNVSCFGVSDGSCTVAPTGGTPAYTYSWSPLGGTGATASGLGAGSYTCTITDANGCIRTKNFLVTQPTSLIASAASQTDNTCNGGTNGSASVSASGGTPAYSFAWAPSGGTAATANSLAAANYTCTVTDANGCTTTQTFAITEPVAIILSMSGSDENCNSADGTASAAPSLGVAPYTFVWAPGGQTTASIVSQSAGTYTCTVTDANGCSTSNTFIVNNIGCSNPPLAGFNSTSPSICVGGSVSYTDMSTETPTSWSWTFQGGSPSGSNAQNPTVIYNTPGSYDVILVATNASGSGSQTVFGYITVNALPTISIVSNPVSGIVCSGSPATLTASGATSYSWTGGITNAVSFTPPATTSYTVTATDGNGCQSTASRTITVNSCSSVTTTVPCGQTFNKKSMSVSAANVPAATSYRFRFYDNVTNALVGQYTQSSRTLLLANVSGIYYNTTYKWTVAVNVGSGFGPESSMSCTIILGQPQTTVPCGVTYTNFNTYSAVTVPGGTLNFRFKFYNSSTNALVAQVTQTSNYIYFNQVPGLNYGNTYKWTVACEYPLAIGGSVYGPESSMNCLITFSAPQTTVPCGNTYTISSGYTAAAPVSLAQGYRFRFYQSSVLMATRAQTSHYIYFNQVPGLASNSIYTWTVEVLYNNGSGLVYGPASTPCNISFGPPAMLLVNQSATKVAAEDNTIEAPALSLEVYPNPFAENITIVTSSEVNAVQVFNAFGELVETLEIKDGTVELHLGNLPNGIYLIQVRTADGVATKTVIKQN
ncbi:MAG: T9SS type A sorting domain-containing protein, partial [Bacteroidota bacterium]|nr:T9SS type A sorting domain-containing protein [Bacteroidota bacterium]